MRFGKIESGQISGLQMALMIYTTVNTTGILLAPAITGRYAQNDLWLSTIWASVIGFVTVFIAIRLNRYFPKDTVIQYSEKLLGSILGKIASGLFLLFLLHINGIVIREYTEFISGMFLGKTPLVVIMGGMALLAAFTARGGIEVLGRIAQLLIPSTLVIWIILLLLTIPDWDVANILPVMEYGIMPSIRGSLVPQTWFSELFLMAFLLPYIKNQASARKWGTGVVIISAANLSILNIISIFVFGSLVSTLTYPVMVLIRYISIGGFFEHIDALLLIIWVLGAFVKISFIQYCIVLGIGQLLRVEDFRSLSLPVGLLLMVFGIWAASDVQVLSHYLQGASYFYLLTSFIAYPLLLLIIAFIRRKLHLGGS